MWFSPLLILSVYKISACLVYVCNSVWSLVFVWISCAFTDERHTSNCISLPKSEQEWQKTFFLYFQETVWHFRAGSIDEREKAAIGLQFLSQSAFSWGNYVVLLYVKDWIRLCFFSPSPSLAIRETWMEKSDCFPSSSGVSCNQVCTWIQGKLPHLCCYFIIKVSTHQ